MLLMGVVLRERVEGIKRRAAMNYVYGMRHVTCKLSIRRGYRSIVECRAIELYEG